MPTPNFNLPEIQDRKDKSKLEWLRSAAKEGFESIDRAESM